MGADRFSPLTLTKCSGRGRVNLPLIYTSRAAHSLDTQGSAAVPDWVHKNIYFFFQSQQVFDASGVAGRPDAFAEWLWVTGNTMLLQSP